MTVKFACFVTGTDTGVGKTLVSAALLHALSQSGLRAVGMKPVAAGTVMIDGVLVNEDTESLAAAGSLVVPRALTTPYLLDEAAAPHLAAQMMGVTISSAHILDCYRQLADRAEAVVVEGVGGFCVPLAEGFDTADLAMQLALPVVLVVGIRLGCLNHALLTVEAIRARGLTLTAWVANLLETDMPHAAANIATLTDALKAPLLGIVPRLAVPDAIHGAKYLDLSLLNPGPINASSSF